MEKEVSTTLRDIIEEVFNQYKTMTETEIYSLDSWCVYAEDIDLDLDSECYIADYPDFDDDDEEVPITFVEENGLELCYRDETIVDVVGACLHQKTDVSLEEVLKALEYYMENDSFLEL